MHKKSYILSGVLKATFISDYILVPKSGRIKRSYLFRSWQEKETQKNNIVVSLDYFKNSMRGMTQYDRGDLLMRKASSLLEITFIRTTLCMLCSCSTLFNSCWITDSVDFVVVVVVLQFYSCFTELVSCIRNEIWSYTALWSVQSWPQRFKDNHIMSCFCIFASQMAEGVCVL